MRTLAIKHKTVGTQGWGLLKPKHPWDLTVASSVTGFNIDYTIYVGTAIGIGFLIGGVLYKLDAAGNLAVLATQAYTAQSLAAEGNAPQELAEYTDVPGLVGKEVTPVIAMTMPQGGTPPSIKLGVNFVYASSQYDKIMYSPEYTLAGGAEATILKAMYDDEASAGGAVNVMASLFNGGSWGAYMSLDSIVGMKATKVRFRATYTATTIGASLVKLKGVKLYCTVNDADVSSTKAEVVIWARDVEMAVSYVRSKLVHSKLEDADVSALVCFSSAVTKRIDLELGIGTGDKETFNLTDDGIDVNTIKVANGNIDVLDFDYNMLTKELAFTTVKGKMAYVSYDCNISDEVWHEMTKGETMHYQNSGDLYSTEFYYTLPEDAEAKHIMCLKYVFERKPGTANEILGTADGSTQMYTLEHTPDVDSLKVEGADFFIDGKTLRVAAPAGTILTAEYDYSGQTPVGKAYIAAFNHD